MLQLETLFYDEQNNPIESWLDDDGVTVHLIDSVTHEVWVDISYEMFMLLRFWILGY